MEFKRMNSEYAFPSNSFKTKEKRKKETHLANAAKINSLLSPLNIFDPRLFEQNLNWRNDGRN